MKAEKYPLVTLLYYPPKIYNAGHVAVKVQYPDPKGKYSPARETILDFGGKITLLQTEEKFGKPIAYPLPPPPNPGNYFEASSFIVTLRVADFNLLTNNCTTATVKLLTEFFGYDKITYASTVEMPKNLENQIKHNYSLQYHLDKIFDYAVEDKHWTMAKKALTEVFQLDSKHQLKEDFHHSIYWAKAADKIKELMEDNKIPRTTFGSFFQSEDRVPERYKMLLKLLKVVDQYPQTIAKKETLDSSLLSP